MEILYSIQLFNIKKKTKSMTSKMRNMSPFICSNQEYTYWLQIMWLMQRILLTLIWWNEYLMDLMISVFGK
jgi:hypothetical protein